VWTRRVVVEGAARIVVAVLTWHGEAVTRRCLTSLSRLDGWPFPTVVIDNASGTGEGERLAVEFGGPVTALTLPTNEGVPGGYNAALRKGFADGATHVLLLNNDVVFPDPRLVSRLLAATGPKVAAVGPVVLDPDGSIFSAGGLMDWRRGRPHHRRRTLRTDEPYDAEWLDGPCLLVSLEAVRAIGGLAPEYFMYSEELDWGVRARRGGYRLLVEPRTAVQHDRSTRRPTMRVRELSLRNAILFMRRSATGGENVTSLLWALLYRPVAMAFRCLARPSDLVQIPGVVVAAFRWNLQDARARGSWRVPATGPDLAR
jgi:GT2 family glycosyltransferase